MPRTQRFPEGFHQALQSLTLSIMPHITIRHMEIPEEARSINLSLANFIKVWIAVSSPGAQRLTKSSNLWSFFHNIPHSTILKESIWKSVFRSGSGQKHHRRGITCVIVICFLYLSLSLPRGAWLSWTEVSPSVLSTTTCAISVSKIQR